MAPPVASIDLLGRSHAVILPSLADREDLAQAYLAVKDRKGVAKLRVYCAALGLCTRIGREAKADFGKAECNVHVYGGEVYSWLREQGLSPQDISGPGFQVLLEVMNALAPREEEIKERRDFSKAGGEPTT